MPNPKFWQRNPRKSSQGAFSFGHIPGLAPQASQGAYDETANVYPILNHPDLPSLPSRSRSTRLVPNPESPATLRENRRSFIQQPDAQVAQNLGSLGLVDKSNIPRVWQQPSFEIDSEPVQSLQTAPSQASGGQEEAIGWAIQQAPKKSPSPPKANSPYKPENTFEGPPMPMAYAPSNTSSESASPAGLDRWSQRRLQRLNTEHSFREQRQGGGSSGSGVTSNSSSLELPAGYNSATLPDTTQQKPVQQAQPQSIPQGSYPNPSTTTSPTLHNLASPPLTDSSSRSPSHQQHDHHQQQYSPPDVGPQYSTHGRQVTLQPSRSFTQGNGQDEASGTMSQPNAPLSAPKAVRNNRQSVHTGVSPNTQHASHPVPAMTQSNAQAQQQRTVQQTSDVSRGTPQPQGVGEEMSDEDVSQLIRDHKELREKYTKVKKYYFEKEDQVKQLQNSLAHQKLAQSRTSLDDSEYATRFNRLDGLTAQLAFSIRKSWKTVPSWLAGSVNKDAIMTGKQEMTAAGRAFISCWLVEEVFEKCFHPDLDPTLSAQLKSMQRNIRRFAPTPQAPEEEDYLTAKVVNWRLTTLEGLQDLLRSPVCAQNRGQLMDLLKVNLIEALQIHLNDPPMSDLEGGVHMIIELAVSMSTHLPLESRDVLIEYFMPGTPLSTEMMKSESGIPALGTSVAEDAAERMSMKSAGSDALEAQDTSSTQITEQPRKRSMLSALTGTKKSHAAQGKHAGAGGSTASLGRPESAGGKEELPPRVRMSVGIGAQVRGKTVLVKAPIFST